MRRGLTALLLTLAALLAAGALTAAADVTPAASRVGLLAAVRVVPVLFATADRTHDEARATQARSIADALAAGEPSPAARLLRRSLAGSEVELQPWPLPADVSAAATRLENGLALSGPLPRKPYGQIRRLLTGAQEAARAGHADQARLAAVEAYALYQLGPGLRLQGGDSTLAGQTAGALWRAVLDVGTPQRLTTDVSTANAGLRTDATVLGDARPSRASIVADAAVIVFREGLEAVLILAAITASFTGERRRLRRPVLVGGLFGLVAAGITYALAQEIVSALGDGGQRLQAITGLLAIAVLLVVTNWFFHKVYWSEWIARFNRRKRSLERFDRIGFISGQTAAFIVLGLTSVYREGFETVLFLQNLQVSAGTGATLLGVAFGLGATLIVGTVTFVLEQKLPYRRMLIATGVLIGLVLAVMVGTTAHTLQGLGWLPTHATPFHISLGAGRWLGLFATWEGIASQVLALLVVYGSYAVARALQSRRRRTAIARSAEPAAAI